jgi:plastocyanin
MRKLALVVTLGVCGSLALAACGGGGGSSSTTAAAPSTTTAAGGGGGGPAQTVKVAADPNGNLRYQESTLQAKAGNVEFDFTNPDTSLPHNFCLQSSSGQQFGCSGTVTGSSDTLSVSLKPGTYTYYCNVDSHQQAGMTGTLSVK